MSLQNCIIQVTGIVQGVGFRPFVYNLALQKSLTGWVRNTSHGVDIEISGETSQIEQFTAHLKQFPPPLAQIHNLSISFTPYNPYSKFEIYFSRDSETDFLPISPDISICKDCAKELFDPINQRYRYPFINCTNCGPRFTITNHIPYDRPNTSMVNFQMCEFCEKEYHDPVNRRFHAQPIACPNCGPKVWFEANGVTLGEKEKAIQIARQWLKDGKILAIKGLGGFHLACDAQNKTAIDTLRQRKNRSDKPFALMAFDIATIKKYCEISDVAETLLTSSQSPIVLLKPKPISGVLLNLCAPHQNHLGFFLPYTPLHLLLLEPENEIPEIWVMTSANMSEEPIAYQNEQAIDQLGILADGYLMHDRPITMRIDDSVFSVIDNLPYPIRRARGFAPNPVLLPFDTSPILGTGALLKNTFCLSRDRYAFVSHYIGDLENFETLQSYQSAINHYENLFRIKPNVIACDMHPDYLSTRYAYDRHAQEKIPFIEVQHHHAHIAANMAENQWDSKESVIGLSYDGTGFGPDGNIWGGEILIASYQSFERRFQFNYVTMPGGDLAIKFPARMAISHLISAGIELESCLPPINFLTSHELEIIQHQINNGINAPMTSSIGRLFDAVSSLIGQRHIINYEGQAAIELEAIADEKEFNTYPIEIYRNVINIKSLMKAIVNDLKKGEKPSTISAKFHNTISDVSVQACQIIKIETGIKHVALSGGVWQNKFLTSRTLDKLRQFGFVPLIHQILPPNDSCISLGQVMVALHQNN